MRFFTWLRMKFKPRKCRKCKHDTFLVFEKLRYKAHIDAQTKEVVSERTVDSVIEKVVCANPQCGEPLPLHKVELASVTLAA